MEVLLLGLLLWSVTAGASGYFEAMGADAYDVSKNTVARLRAGLRTRNITDKQLAKSLKNQNGPAYSALREILSADAALDRDARLLLSSLIAAQKPNWSVSVSAVGSQQIIGMEVPEDFHGSADVKVKAFKSRGVVGLRIGGTKE